MQVTGVYNRGWGSALECRQGTGESAYKAFGYEEGKGYTQHRYYTNTRQGIYANVKDGLRALQYHYYSSWNRTNPNIYAKWAGAAWRYNHGDTEDTEKRRAEKGRET